MSLYSSLLYVRRHITTRVSVNSDGTRARGLRVSVGTDLVTVGYNSCELCIGLLAANRRAIEYGGIVQAIPRVDSIVASALRQKTRIVISSRHLF